MNEIPRNKPKEIVWDREWVAMHTEFVIPGVEDAGFLAEFKLMMIEVAGERLYDYRAVTEEQIAAVRSRISERRAAREKRRAEDLAKAIEKSQEECKRRNSSEAMLEKERERYRRKGIIE